MRQVDIGRKRSGAHSNPRRHVSLPEEAWALVDQAADAQVETWLEWLGGVVAIAVAQQLKIDEADTLALFDRER